MISPIKGTITTNDANQYGGETYRVGVTGTMTNPARISPPPHAPP
uniref:Uncharacterized protein n=1 Tax=Escherichia coli TaxID=562 RepID=A0A891ZWY2_ECOLX|nr:hypothetical protein [Escherichia coli]